MRLGRRGGACSHSASCRYRYQLPTRLSRTRLAGAGLKLTAEQLEEVRMCTAVHAASVAPVAQERIKLASELSATICAAVGQQVASSGDVIKVRQSTAAYGSMEQQEASPPCRAALYLGLITTFAWWARRRSPR